MPKFLFVYHMGETNPGQMSQEAQQASMAAWGKWMGDHQAALVDPGDGVGKSFTVSKGGIAKDGGANPAAGYSIVEAADIDAACAIAKGNPMIGDGGSIEVAPLMMISM